MFLLLLVSAKELRLLIWFWMSTWYLIFRVWNNDYNFQLKFFAEYVWLWSLYFRCFQTYLYCLYHLVLKYPNTKSWLFFWCCCFNFFNTFIFRCFFWRLILVCSLLVRVLSSITLHSRRLLSFNWFEWFSLYLNAGTIFFDVFNHLSYDDWLFFPLILQFGFVRAVSAAERIWISIKISIFTWCVCV